MNDKHKNLDFEKFINIFNSQGKKAAKEFVLNVTTFNYDYYVKLLKKYTGYIYNRPLKKYEKIIDDSNTFMSMDDLLGKGNSDATEVVASIPQKVYINDPANSLIIDLYQDRLMELSKYIKITTSTKTIEINTTRLRDSGYDINIIN